MAPNYLIDKVNMFIKSTNISLRPDCGRDFLMFECSLKQTKSSNWISKMISEWNILPLSIRSISNFLAFKKELKTFFFKEAYPDYC